MSRLQEQYKNEIIPKLKEELGMSNALSVPKIEKITINMGLGSALGDKKVLESALEELSLITDMKIIWVILWKNKWFFMVIPIKLILGLILIYPIHIQTKI